MSNPEAIREREDNRPYLALPVLREELAVEKRRVTTGIVRLRKVVHKEERVVDEPVTRSEVDVERVSVNRIVDGPLPVRQEGETSIYSVVEEVFVVTKQFILKEEVRVTHRTMQSYDRQLVTLRAEEISIEREQFVEPGKFQD